LADLQDIDMVSLLKLPSRIGDKIEPEPNSGCWLWSGSGQRYGQIDLGERSYKVHRLLYELYVGGVGDGEELDHLCQTGFCVNPNHLEPVTHKENCHRGKVNQGFANWTHCAAGHEYARTGFYVWPSTGNERHCKECIRIKNARRYL
jgi:hypothetical protein